MGVAPSSPRLSATPPPLGRRRLRLIFSKVHLLPRCWSSTTRLPFFRPISLRFCPSRPVRLRLSSQSRPASNPFCVVSGAVRPRLVRARAPDAGNVGARPASLLEATPVASGLAVSPAETVTWPSGVMRTASSASTRLRLSARSRPISSAVPESFTSAFGAVATMALVAVAHDDVADAHGDANSSGPLDLRAADLDRIAVADIVLDRRGQPGRCHIEIDRTGAEPPPQPAETGGEDHRQHARSRSPGA